VALNARQLCCQQLVLLILIRGQPSQAPAGTKYWKPEPEEALP